MNSRAVVRFGLLGAPAFALVAGPLQLDRGLVSGGGGAATTARFSVIGSIGQPVANSSAATASPLAGRAGFWSQVVRWVNVPPTPVADTVERRPGQGAHVLATQLVANDGDGDWDPLQFVSVEAVSANGGTVVLDGPWVVYLPPGGGDPLASDSFAYHVTDGVGAPVAGTVTVLIAAPPGTTASPLEIRALAGAPAQVEVRFQGIAGRAYRIETAPAVNGPWTGAGNLVAGATGVLTFTEPVAVEPRFFRILEPSP